MHKPTSNNLGSTHVLPDLVHLKLSLAGTSNRLSRVNCTIHMKRKEIIRSAQLTEDNAFAFKCAVLLPSRNNTKMREWTEAEGVASGLTLI